MDIQQAVELMKDIDEQIKLSREYFNARIKAANANIAVDQLLAVNIAEYRREKPNVGYDMAIIMLMENNETARDAYREMQIQTATYKGLEKILDSISTKISYYQSVMKYQLTGERNG